MRTYILFHDLEYKERQKNTGLSGFVYAIGQHILAFHIKCVNPVVVLADENFWVETAVQAWVCTLA